MEKAPEAFRTISEVADELEVPKHVLRFWEAKFAQLKPMKRGGGRRYYRPEDVSLLRGIRLLLYSDGYTIRGVQKILREHGARYVMDYRGLAEEAYKEASGGSQAEEAALDLAGVAQPRAAKTRHGAGTKEDKIHALLDEIEICRQILRGADTQD